MAKHSVERNRLLLLCLLASVVSAAFLFILMRYQIVDGAKYNAETYRTNTTRIDLKAARGDIVDRDGVALATNTAQLNIVFYYTFFPKSSQNEIIASLIALCEEKGEDWIDDLPLDETGENFLEGREKDVETLKSFLGLNVYATAENCVYYLLEDYGIQGYDQKTARKIAGVRYSMSLAEFSVNNNSYRFAEDISMETALSIKEMSDIYPGVEIVEEDARVYPEGDTAPHILGTIGAMYAEEYTDTYRDHGYALNSYVGKFGIEKKLELELHGSDGEKTIIQDGNGNILNEEITTEPQAGNTVVLTISSAFQKKVAEILNNHMEYLRTEVEKEEDPNHVKAGAVVVLDAQNGEVLAMVTNPSYDINDYFSSYSQLLAAENNPLINRATDGLYRPGSTFKTIVATAAMEEGLIAKNSTIRCTHTYYYYDIIPGNTFHPTCLGTHGLINVVNALTVSCNIFFYDVGRQLGIHTINRYANDYGLGVDTGLELSSSKGALSSPERSEALGSTWVQGNVVQASIGQMDTLVTPLQLAIQAMTLANKGTRYAAHLVKEIRSYDGETTLLKTQPEILSQLSVSDAAWEAVTEGMVGAAARVTKAGSVLTDLGYDVALKTGTPQVTTDTTNSVAVAFAPTSSPKLAIGIVLEEGADASHMIRKIIDAYEELYGSLKS